MSKDLEKALSKLRFDEQVIGYSLMTKVGRPFVSFAFPDELFPRVKDSINLYKSDLRLMTIDTEKGLVVLSPVDDNWILTVLYVPELQLGLAIAKTKNVLRLLEGIELPPPPEDFEESAESNLQVLESIAIRAASTAPEIPAEVEEEAAQASEVSVTSPILTEPPSPETKTPQDFMALPHTVPERGEVYSEALSLEAPLYAEMKKTYRNFGFDVLMLVDGKMNVGQIADSMFQPTEKVGELLKWAACKNIVTLPDSISEEEAQPVTMGRFVKCPKFEGDLEKVKPEDRQIISLCDGTRSTEQIAEETDKLHSKIIQTIAKYRKHGLKMIGKTI